MSRPDEKADQSNTASQSELNPLLNPILSKHMGRWAEVYFNSPPELREVNVLELIRELEHQAPGASTLPSFQRLTPSGNPSIRKSGATSPVICLSCGYVNRPQHKFCGRCGLGLSPEPLADLGDRAENEPASPPREHFVRDRFLHSRAEAGALFPQTFPTLSMESEVSQRSYRPYIGIVLAMVVVSLAYYAWRANQSNRGISTLPQQAPQAASNAPEHTAQPTTPTPDTTSSTQPGTQPSSTAATAPAATAPGSAPPPPTAEKNPNTPATAAKSQPMPAATEPSRADTKPASPATTAPAPTSGTEQAVAGRGGSDELTMAKGYLDGAYGRARNPAQAIPWLWKSVGKRNLEATMLLATLYLHGDGVAKNCDQARLLLDAAAIKGRKDAAEQLRNLRAFGCQ